MLPVAAIILAAGASTRMSRPKQLIAIDDETLVHRAARAAIEAGCDPIRIVTGRNHDAIAQAVADLAVQCVPNPDWERGLGTSIKCGVRSVVGELDSDNSLKHRAVLIHLCDQPLIDGVMIRRLIDAWRKSEKPVAVSAWNDTIGPPVVVDALLIPSLEALPDASGAKAIWADHPHWLERAPCAAAGVDLDTPDDLVRFTGSQQ